MVRYRFKFLIFERDNFREEVTTTQGFIDDDAVVQAMVSFAAMQSLVRSNPLVMPLYTPEMPINLPPSNNGYGPDTIVVIASATLFVEPVPTTDEVDLILERSHTAARSEL